MKIKIPCPHCDRIFSATNKDRFTMPRLRGNLALHIKAHHPEHYVPKVRPKAKYLHTDGKFSALLDEPPKRPYVRRIKPTVETHHAKFCPECGANIQIINEAIKMGRGQ